MVLPEFPCGDDTPLAFLTQEWQGGDDAGFEDAGDGEVRTALGEGRDEGVSAVAGDEDAVVVFEEDVVCVCGKGLGEVFQDDGGAGLYVLVVVDAGWA